MKRKKISQKKNRPVGCPTSYRPQYPQMIVDFFAPPYYLTKDLTITKPDGTQIDKTEMEALPPRFLSGFAQTIGISLLGYRETFSGWAEKYKEFGDALKTAKELETEMIRTNAIMGLYNPAFSIFTMKNIAGWRDSQYLDGKPLIDASQHFHFTSIKEAIENVSRVGNKESKNRTLENKKSLIKLEK